MVSIRNNHYKTRGEVRQNQRAYDLGAVRYVVETPKYKKGLCYFFIVVAVSPNGLFFPALALAQFFNSNSTLKSLKNDIRYRYYEVVRKIKLKVLYMRK